MHSVRCGSDHHSSACPNSRQDPMRCALCSSNYTANYKGCSINTNLQHRKKLNSNNLNLPNSKFNHSNVQDSHPSNNTPSNHPPVQSQTYAQANLGQPSPQNTPLQISDINILMSSFLNEFKILINQLISLLTKVITS